jgi:hypothetical protein
LFLETDIDISSCHVLQTESTFSIQSKIGPFRLRGDLYNAPAGKAPTFLVAALKDPIGANLDRIQTVGNTVDVKNATWTNTIGDPELITVWKDPNFDPKQRAFYYARIIEIPTPRWTSYDAKYFGIEFPKEVPMMTQERGYTSPIWCTSGK